MKKPLLPLLGLACLVFVWLALPGCGEKPRNAEVDEVYKGLVKAYVTYLDGESSIEEVLALCDQALDSPAANDSRCLVLIYTLRITVFADLDDSEQLEIELDKAVAAMPDSISNWEIMTWFFDFAYGTFNELEALVQERVPKGLLREKDSAITPAALDAAFAADEHAATEKYYHKLLTVRGVIADLDLENRKKPFLVFVGSGPKREVICALRPNAHEEYADLKPGQTVTVSGLCRDRLENGLMLSSCKLLDAAP